MMWWKTGAVTGALLLAAAGGAALAPVASGQSRDSLERALQIFGREGQLGVTIRDTTGDDKQAGVIVEEVRGGSAAEKAGFKSGDLIVEFDAEHVRSVSQFRRLVQETPVGRKVQAIVVRGGQRTTLSVAPERGSSLYFGDDMQILRPPTPPAAPEPPRAARPYAMPSLPGFEFNVRGADGRLGISVEDLTDQLRDYFGVKEGVLVRSVRDGSPAAKAGVKAGDVIVTVNGRHVNDASDVTQAVGRMEAESEFTIEVSRDRKTQTLKGKLEPRTNRIRSSARTIV
jgi:serine protease Do